MGNIIIFKNKNKPKKKYLKCPQCGEIKSFTSSGYDRIYCFNCCRLVNIQDCKKGIGVLWDVYKSIIGLWFMSGIETFLVLSMIYLGITGFIFNNIGNLFLLIVLVIPAFFGGYALCELYKIENLKEGVH